MPVVPGIPARTIVAVVSETIVVVAAVAAVPVTVPKGTYLSLPSGVVEASRGLPEIVAAVAAGAARGTARTPAIRPGPPDSSERSVGSGRNDRRPDLAVVVVADGVAAVECSHV